MHKSFNFNENPSIVTWELTRTFEYENFYWQTEKTLEQNENELTYEEGLKLIDQIYNMNNPHLIFSGGDCVLRHDLLQLAEYAINKGMSVAMRPLPTRNLTKEIISEAKAIGLTDWGFNLNGPTPEIHDHFCRMPGSFDLTIEKIHYLNELKINHQINTVITRYNYGLLEEIAKLVAELKASTWNISTFVPPQREQIEDCITPLEHEKLFECLFKLEKTAPFIIKTTESQHYRRVILQKKLSEQIIDFDNVVDEMLIKDYLKCSPQDVNDGNGTLYISHVGDVYPSRHLPIKIGNIRETSLAHLYRNNKILKQIRNIDDYKGKCRKCEYRAICGGSRARAYAVTGDYLASEPFCIYVPEQIRSEMKKVSSQ